MTTHDFGIALSSLDVDGDVQTRLSRWISPCKRWRIDTEIPERGAKFFEFSSHSI